MKIYVHLSYSNYDEVEIVKVPGIYSLDSAVYITAEDVTLQDYAQEWKDKVKKLEKRCEYLEQSKNWVITNLRGLIK